MTPPKKTKERPTGTPPALNQGFTKRTLSLTNLISKGTMIKTQREILAVTMVTREMREKDQPKIVLLVAETTTPINV